MRIADFGLWDPLELGLNSQIPIPNPQFAWPPGALASRGLSPGLRLATAKAATILRCPLRPFAATLRQANTVILRPLPRLFLLRRWPSRPRLQQELCAGRRLLPSAS